MVEHVVLFRWTEEACPEAIDRAVVELNGLKDKIAAIVDLSCGANFSDRANGYTHGLVVRFADRAALDTYIRHPDHQQAVQNFINPISADILAFDYEF